MKGLKVYEDMFTASELLRLSEFINELRLAGHRGELSGLLKDLSLFCVGCSISLFITNFGCFPIIRLWNIHVVKLQAFVTTIIS